MMKQRRIRLVHNWRQWPRWASQQAFLIQIAMLGSWQALPDDLKSTIPTWLVATVAIGICVLGFIGRLWDQTPAERADDAQ